MSELLQQVRASLTGRYAVDSEIGRGGMAVVFLATDVKHERAVAVKVLTPDVASSVGEERFLREIRVAAKLNHPNILPLYDSGSVDGFLYYVMPYVEGESLRERIRREGPLAVNAAVDIVQQVAGALAHAHAQGIVHRDVKPENILLSGDFALLTDFGIARALSAAGGERLTRPGVAVGTPHYMSPEQTMGDERLSGRSDQYSLACVLYELLAGGPPFAGPTPEAVLRRHSLDPVPPLRTVRSSTPEWLEAAVLRALAKVPADRFESMDAFGAALSGPRPSRDSLFERVRKALEPRYELEDRVDAGGMAIVFRARDASLRRTVAVKVLRPELATATAAERLLREARTLAGFSHPNVVAIHEVGERDGLYFYVMDYVDGETLEERLAGGPLDRGEALALARDLLTALESVHAAGVIHRDVKPGNIFLVPDRALLSDFGIAKHVDTPGEAITRAGHVAGTPAYMAPEQAAGQQVTGRTDLYSAALVLYEVLTGRRWTPFADPERGDWRGVPRRWERSLRRALELNPDDRWPDAAAFRASLETAEPSRITTRRWGLAAGTLLFIAVSATVLLVARRPGPPLLDLALFPCEPIGVDAGTARDLSLALAHNLSNIPGLSLVSARTAFNLFDARGGDVGPEDWRRLRAREAVRCVVTERDGLLRVEMDLFDERGNVRRREGVEAPAQEPPLAAADSAALRIVQTTGAPSLSRDALLSLSGYGFDAVKLFLAGEEAFHRGAHAAADSFYVNALDLDSTLTVARWHLAEVRRWRAHSPIEVDLQALYRLDASALSRLDSLLLDARVQPYGVEQLERYRAVLADDVYRYDAYATLLYADELFHRGGLWGIPIDSGVAMLERAVRRDSFLVPAVEHLTLARIRLSERAEAERLLRHLRTVHPRPGEGADVPYPDAWQHVFVERFDTTDAELSLDGLLQLSSDRMGLLALGSRYVRYADAPNAQIRLGRRLVAMAGPEAAYASLGHVAQALGRISQGQVLAGFAHFDSVAARNRSAETEVQAAEWRVVPFALGLEGFPEQEARRGAARLAELWKRPGLGALMRVRTAWALALLAHRDGLEAEAALWSDRVDSHVTEGEGDRLSRLLGARRQALSGRYDVALAETEADLSYDSAGLASRPFARSALYLSRGDWFRGRYDALGDSDDLGRAIGSWYWHENTDLEITEPQLVQASEVDGALGAWGRLRTIRAARQAPPTYPPGLLCTRSYDLLRLWVDPDPPLRSVLEEVRRAMTEAGCDR